MAAWEGEKTEEKDLLYSKFFFAFNRSPIRVERKTKIGVAFDEDKMQLNCIFLQLTYSALVVANKFAILNIEMKRK